MGNKVMEVPFVDLKSRYLEEREDILTGIDQLLSEGHLILTEEVADFERELGEYIGVRNVVSVNSGTDALMLCLWALGVKRGDEVITTPISFVATAAAIAHVGAIPKFVDVTNDQNIDPDKIASAVTERTKAILPVHWGGRVCDMEKISDVAKRHNLSIIEDAAQGIGSVRDGKRPGAFGHLASFSAHPLKNLNALGDAGFLTTDDDEYADKIRIYRNHGLRSRDNVEFFGINSRMDSLHAKILSIRLRKLNQLIEQRRRNVQIYRDCLKLREIFIPPESSIERSSYVMFIVQAEARDELQKFLKTFGIETLVYYGTPLHLQRASQYLGYVKGDFPVAERQCEKVLALPHHQGLSAEQIEYVAEKINEFYGV